jgi:hypothetical protein
LDDVTFFLQGNPFDHAPNILKSIHDILTTSNININMFQHFAKRLYHTTLVKCPHKLLTRDKKRIDIPMKTVAPLLLGSRYPKTKTNDEDSKVMQVTFAPGAQFMVSKECILQNPVSYYKNMQDIVSQSSDPIEGHVLERIWSLVFGS